jgi:putative transposase
MTEEQRLEKNKAIKNSKIATGIKRKSQVCRVYKCKIQSNKLSAAQKLQLKMMFVEAKWIWNDALGWCSQSEENKPWDYKLTNIVHHFDKDNNSVEHKLQYLHSQMKQEVIKLLCTNIKALSSLKKKGHKVGRVRFKSNFDSLHVKQCTNTSLKLKSGRYCKIPKISGLVRVNGLSQFINKPEIEIACFDILNTPLGYYISFCTYQDKKYIEKRKLKNKAIGIDFGCSTSFTTSEGKKYNCIIEESGRLKHLQRKLTKKKGFKRGDKKSNNYMKLLCKIRREYASMGNRKNDLANKTAHELSDFSTVVIQDEQISSWSRTGHGKKVQHSILGRVKSRLLSKPNAAVINRYAPTTKLCTKCGTVNRSLSLYDRVFRCSCGAEEDRDIHAAKNMVWMFENKIGMGRTKFKPVEFRNQVDAALNCNYAGYTVKQEDSSL